MGKQTKCIALVKHFFLVISAAAAETVIHDGDTLTLDGAIYRLDGIDAPELDQSCIKKNAR